MMATSPVIVSNRYGERAMFGSLNDRFQQYVNRVRSMREQSKTIENNTFLAHTQALENEIFDLKNIYERELENCRYQLDSTTAEKNSAQLDANKNSALASELKEKYDSELNNRKKLENAVADAHRLLSEKDSLIQELRITIAQHQNAHLDTTKERDNLQSSLTNTQIMCDTEMKARADLEATTQKLSDQIQFERQIHEKECMELNNKIAAAERAIAIADEKLREHDIVDDNLHNMISKMRLQTQNEFKRYQEESESVYQSSIQTIKSQLENETKNLAQAFEENIHLKAVIEEMNVKIGKLDSRCGSLDEQNRSLIHTLEVERQQAANSIHNLESKLREMQENLNSKIRELNLAYNANIPLDMELEAFANLLDAEEKRLSLALSNPPSELVQSARGDLLSTRHYAGMRSLPSSPRRPVTVIGSSTVPVPPFSRPKSTPAVVDETIKDIPAPIFKPLTPPKYYLPYLGDTSSSHSGNIRILEVSITGHFVRIYNISTFQTEDLSGFIIQQNVCGRPVLIFKFPPKTILKAATNLTVWSNSSMKKHNPPTDYLWKTQTKWMTGNNCTTIICRPDGQAVSWITGTTPSSHRKIENYKTGNFSTSSSTTTVAKQILTNMAHPIIDYKNVSHTHLNHHPVKIPARLSKSAPCINGYQRPIMRSYGWIH